VKLLYALLCEDARARADGRLDVDGIFHQLYAPGFPAQQDRLVLAMAVEWGPYETGRIDFKIDLLDPTDSPSLTINGHTDVAPQVRGEAPPVTRLVMPLENIVFPQAGTYEFELQVGEERVRLAPLHLIEDPAAHSQA
jgi:hypothetical protein